MFEDDDFEIDEEFLDGVFDAEKSAVRSDISYELSNQSLENSLNSDIELSPAKKRRLSPSNRSPTLLDNNPGPALRTSEESAQLVTDLAQRLSASHRLLPNHRDANQSGIVTQQKSKPPFGCLAAFDSNKSNLTRVSASQVASIDSEDSSSYDNCADFNGNASISRKSWNNNGSSDSSFHLNTSRVRQRKFPGPAGLLPDRSQRPTPLNISGSDLDESDEPLCSQSSASVLEDGPWSALNSDLSREGQGLLRHYTVAWVKKKAAARQLVGQKVPFLAAVLHSIDCSSPDPCVVLRDATGEIPGTLHRSVWDCFGGQLIAGSALVLRLVGVLSTGVSARRHYLNITSNNIVTIYSSPLCDPSPHDSSNRSVRKTDVQNWTLNQLLQTVNNWEDQGRKRKEAGFRAPLEPRNEFALPQGVLNTRQTTSSGVSSPVRPQVQTAQKTTSAPVPPILNVASSSSNTFCMRPPLQVTSKHNSGAPSLSRSSSGKSVPSGSSQMVATRSIVPMTLSSNSDAFRQQSTNSNASSSTSAQSRFVPKKPTYPVDVPPRNEVPQPSVLSNSSCTTSFKSSHQENARSSQDLNMSKDLFSDADDLDISSVLDGIDSESLFGDF